LHEQVENLAFIVDSAPEPELPPGNRHRHLIETPLRRRPRASTAKFSGEQSPELPNPSPYRFAGDIQTALREQIFNVAIAERETHIEPNGVPDNHKGGTGGGQTRSSCAILPAKRTRAIVRVTTPPSLVLPSGARRSLHKPWGKKELPV
jgi:hypothetical protein